MFGAIYGDIIGSYYETHCTKDYHFPFQSDSSFTDDTVLIAAVAQAILQNPADIQRKDMRRRSAEYAVQYRQFYSRFPDAGFGQMFSAWAKNPHAHRGHSYANGAAMRVIPIAYAYDSLEQVLLQTKASALPTHKHREAIKGAMAVAATIFLARSGKSKEDIRSYIERHFFPLNGTIEEIRKTHIFNSRTAYSVPPAIISFLASCDYESAIRNAVSLGGDADTEACIAGGIAEAFYHDILAHIQKFCENKLDISLKTPVKKLIRHLNP